MIIEAKPTWAEVGDDVQNVFRSAFGPHDVYVDSLPSEYEQKQNIWFLAAENRQILGWLFGRLQLEKNQGIISMIAVHQNAQRRGIASSLLDVFVQKTQAVNIPTIRVTAREKAMFPLLQKKYGDACRVTGRQFDKVDRHHYVNAQIDVLNFE